MNVKSIIRKAAYACFRLFPLKNNRVLFFSYYGEQYSGSPKYIGQFLAEQTDYEVVWAFVFPEKHRDVKGKIVRYGRLAYLYHLATAGTVITNYRMTEQFRKRTGQTYIQTWHSSLRLKMIEKDAEDSLPAHYVEMAKRDSTQIDYLLAGSEKSKEIFNRAFWYNGEIVPIGTPQCDILFQDCNGLKSKVCDYFHIPNHAKIALYAPTFRKGHDTSVYNLDAARVLSALHARFGGEWYLFMRLHPHLVNQANCFTYDEYILEATKYDDVQEILAASDVLISDYSAIIFDFSVTKRPCFLYIPDLAEYTGKDRKLYFNIEELPFELAFTNDELMAKIEAFSEAEYVEKITGFMHAVGSYDDGRACKRVAELIKGREQ